MLQFETDVVNVIKLLYYNLEDVFSRLYLNRSNNICSICMIKVKW